MRTLPLFFFVLCAIGLAGCTMSGDKAPASESEIPLNGRWQVEDIDAGGVIDFSHITMDFSTQGKVTGTTGCNQYTASLAQNDTDVSVTQIVTTRRACAPALNNQQQRFINALRDASTIAYQQDTWLIIQDASGATRLKLIRSRAGEADQ